MKHDAKTTVNHEEIRKWVEERKGKPAMVIATEKNGSGLLRIDFPGFSGEGSLEEVSWDQFFKVFEDRKLAFLYQEKLKNGKESRFFKFVHRDGTATDETDEDKDETDDE